MTQRRSRSGDAAALGSGSREPASPSTYFSTAGERVVEANGGRPDAVLNADEQTWREIAEDLRGGMTAYRRGRLSIRHDLHLGVGFLAATAAQEEGALRFRMIHTGRGDISISEAGAGPPVLMIHGLGATKVSFLPTLAALSPEGYRAIAVDLPGFGDSDKPVLASYDAAFLPSG